MQNLTKETLKIFWAHAKKYPWQLGLLIAFIFIVPAIQTYLPILYKDLINTLSQGRMDDVFNTALYIVILIFAVNFTGNLTRRVLNFLSNFIQLSVMRDLT